MELAVIYQKEELKSIIKECLSEHQAEQASKLDSSTSYSINQVAKMLHRTHPTIKKLVLTGKIPCTPDNRITQEALNNYLAGSQTNKK